jgi:hypothetical protein
MRGSGPWAYAIVNVIHVFGITTFFGSILILDLHLTGLWRRVPLAAVSRATVPVAKVGFAIAATSGLFLLSSNAMTYVGNPFFMTKFPVMALGLLNVWIVSRLPGWKARREREPSGTEQRQLVLFGGLSLVCWLTVITCGRMIGYW